MPSLFKLFSRFDSTNLLDISYKLSQCRTFDSYKSIFQDIRTIVPFEYATSGLVTLDTHGAVSSYDLANINFTQDWMDAYNEQKMYTIDVTVKENFTNFKTQCWSETYKKYHNPKKLLSFAHDFNLLNGYSCGEKSFGPYTKPSMISFVWNFRKRCRRIVRTIEYLAPQIHIALSNVLYARNITTDAGTLSRREREILHWLKNGKSSWDISIILKISEATVNFHAVNIMRKLDVVNRTQAVAVALQRGLITFD